MAASKLTNEDKLKRIIYLGSPDGRYVVGDPEKYSTCLNKESPNIYDEYVKTNPNDLLKLIRAASEDKNFPRRSHLFSILAKTLHHESIADNMKRKVADTVLEICKSDEEFFDFIKYCSIQRANRTVKLSPTVTKTVKKFYQNKSPLELALSYAKFYRYHKWSHTDLIKLAHLKSDTPLKNMVVNYILLKKRNDRENEEERKIMDLITKSEELKSTNEFEVAVPLISELKATILQVSPDLHQSQQVWAAVLENMSVQQILPCLLKLYKLNFLKTNTSTHAHVLASLTTPEKIRGSDLHPIEVFIHMKTFEKGGKPVDPKLIEHLQNERKMCEEDLKKIKTRHETKSPIILNSLQRCMNMACSNITPTNKRFLITIDVTEKSITSPCIGNKGITSLEAAVAYVMIILRIEKDVTVATYNEKDIKIINLEKKGTFSEHLEKLKSHKSSYSQMYAPLEWAASEKKHFDVFINFIHHEFTQSIPKEVREKMPKYGIEPLIKYRKKVNLPNAKLVTFCVSSPRFVVTDNSWNVLDVLGFDVDVCRAVEAFCRGSFC